MECSLNTLVLPVIYESQAMFRVSHSHYGPHYPLRLAELYQGMETSPSCPSKQLHNPLSEPFSPKPRPQFSLLLCSLPEISLSSFPLPSHLPTQECWVFKEIRRYSSLKTKNHTLEIPDFGVRALDSEGIWRPGWHPSCLLNVAFRQNLPLW